MDSKAILERKFDKSFNGYKMEDVDDFLREVAAEFSELEAQNSTLEKKLEVLADKIREYRNDEEAIKEALLGAQKQSASVIAAANERRDNIIADAETEAAVVKAEAEEYDRTTRENADKYNEERHAEAEQTVADANAEKDRIIAECEKKSAELTGAMEMEIKKQETILAKTRHESDDFTRKVLTAYKEHIRLIGQIPSDVENEFVKKISEKRERERQEEERLRAEQEAAQAEAEQAKAVAEEDPELQAVFASDPEQESLAVSPAEAVEETRQPEPVVVPVFEEAPMPKADPDAEQGEDSPFFNKKKRRSKYEKLEFGGNNNKE